MRDAKKIILLEMYKVQNKLPKCKEEILNRGMGLSARMEVLIVLNQKLKISCLLVKLIFVQMPDCSGHGVCEDGVCVCIKGYKGEFCQEGNCF